MVYNCFFVNDDPIWHIFSKYGWNHKTRDVFLSQQKGGKGMPFLELNQKTSRFRSDEILALQRAGGQGSLVPVISPKNGQLWLRIGGNLCQNNPEKKLST